MASPRSLRQPLLVGGLLVSLGLIVGGIWLSQWDKELLSQWANVSQILGLALGVVTALVSFRPASRPAVDSEQAANQAGDMLATVVQQQWADELARRNLRTAALPIRWSVGRNTTGAEVATLRGPGDADRLTEAFIHTPTLRLVVLGGPGAGKSILAMLLALGLLERRPSGGRVPVLLSLSSWLPDQEDLLAWMARRLTEDYPFLAKVELYGAHAARHLVATGRILPILDALDEMPEKLQSVVIQKLNEALPQNTPLVITSRQQQYHAAVKQGGWQVAHMVEIKLQPPDLNHVRAFLTTADQPAAAQRWRPVFTMLRSQAKSPLHLILQTPLMAALARTIYADPATNPQELLAFKTRNAIEQHLLGAVITVSYSRRRPSIPELSTPALGRYGPTRAHNYLVRLAQHMRGPDLQWWDLRNMVPGVVRAWSAALVGGSIVAAVDALFVLAFQLGLGGWSLKETIWWIINYVPLFALGGGALLAFLIGARPFGPKPSRVGAPGQAMNFKLTLLHVASWGCGGGMAARSTGEISDAIIAGLVVGSLAFIYCGALIILRPVDHTVVPNARALLRADRRRALLQMPAIALATSLAFIYMLTKFNDLGIRDASFIGILAGLTGGIILGLHHTAWGHWLLVTRIWMPWRIITFLEDAYARGILRQAGAAYQFRHARLQKYLADPHS